MSDSQTKTCSRCHQAKPLEDFKTDQRKPDGKASSCKACNAVPKVGEMPIAASRALVRLFDSTDPEAWIKRIAEEWRNSVEAIIKVGQSLIDAKAALPHGAFLKMLDDEELPFSAGTAQRLMAIARDARLSNPAHLQYLPASWGTLYELTKLTNDEFNSALAQKIIRADMIRAEVEQIRPLVRAPRIARPMSDAEIRSSDGGVESRGGNPPQETRSMEGYSAVPKTSPLGTIAGVAPGPSEAIMPAGGLAIAHRRDESDEDPREFFPTPPWATRALVERVLRHLGKEGHCKLQKVWEPACGEGHMAETLKEYFRATFASDKYDYPAYPQQHIDFLEFNQAIATDWIITNPPFRQSTAFVQKALKISGYGVGMFVRLAWIEGVTRYEELLKDNPPSLLSIFTERVPLHKGRWLPDGDTFTAYAWLVWIKGMPPQPPFWIPPGCRKQLSKPDDAARFGAVEEKEEEVA